MGWGSEKSQGRKPMEGAPRPLDPGKENAILNPLQPPPRGGEREASVCMGFGVQRFPSEVQRAALTQRLFGR
jgi:hypothetical protein